MRRTAAPCSPYSAATRAVSCSRTSATSRRSCARRSSRSRTAASTSTTASTRAASRARSGRTCARRVSSRAARRSRSSSSRTPTSATSGRSRARCERRRSPGSSSSGGRRTGSCSPTSTRSTSGTAPTGSSRRRGTYFGKGAGRLTLAESALLAGLPADPSLYDPTQHPRAAKQRRHYVLQTMFDQGKITARQLRNASRAPLPKADDVRLPGTQGPGQYFVNYVKDQLIAKYGAGRVFGGGPQGDEHDRPRAAGDGAPGDRERPEDARRARCRARRDRSADRCSAGDGRRLELPREPVQPRDPGRASAGLVVQADRARVGAATGHLAGHDIRVEARRHRCRRPDLARHELRGRLPRPGRPGAGDGLVRQLRLRPADEARRPEGDRQDRARARDPQRARSRTSRSGSARSRSTRST